MALVVTPAEVQAWLEETKLPLVEIDQGLHEAARVLVFSHLAEVYDTSGWTTSTNTPSLVRQVVAIYIAAWVYNRAYSSVSIEGPTYGDKLIAMAESILVSIVNGNADLTDADSSIARSTSPEFVPNDSTGSSQQYDAAGNAIGPDEFSEDIKFTMGMRF
jgi:hypothetical protein